MSQTLTYTTSIFNSATLYIKKFFSFSANSTATYTALTITFYRTKWHFSQLQNSILKLFWSVLGSNQTLLQYNCTMYNANLRQHTHTISTTTSKFIHTLSLEVKEALGFQLLGGPIDFWQFVPKHIQKRFEWIVQEAILPIYIILFRVLCKENPNFHSHFTC